MKPLPDQEALIHLCAEELSLQGLDREHAEALALLVERALASPIPHVPQGITLADACAHQAQAELEVLLPRF